MVSSKSRTRRSILRSTLDKRFPTASELSAFILDHFPKIYRTLSDGSDRYSRVTALLEREEILDELEQILEISHAQGIGQHEINHSEISHSQPALQERTNSEQRKTRQDTQNFLAEPPDQSPKSRKRLLDLFAHLSAQFWLCLLIPIGIALSISTQRGINASEQCRHCEASCMPELIEEIKDCTALREVVLFSDTESTARDNIKHAISHSGCTLDAITKQLTAGNVYTCSNPQYRAKLFSLMNLISKFGQFRRANEVSIEYQNACISNHDWQACIKSGESRKTRQAQCDDFRKACLAGSRQAKESCIPYFYPDFECPLNGEFTAKYRDEILNDLCENSSSSLACYSLGWIWEATDSCQANEFYMKACMSAKKLPLVCSILLGKSETEFIGKDCERSGRWACKSIKRLADQGLLSGCSNGNTYLNHAKKKLDAIGDF